MENNGGRSKLLTSVEWRNCSNRDHFTLDFFCQELKSKHLFSARHSNWCKLLVVWRRFLQAIFFHTTKIMVLYCIEVIYFLCSSLHFLILKSGNLLTVHTSYAFHTNFNGVKFKNFVPTSQQWSILRFVG